MILNLSTRTIIVLGIIQCIILTLVLVLFFRMKEAAKEMNALSPAASPLNSAKESVVPSVPIETRQGVLSIPVEKMEDATGKEKESNSKSLFQEPREERSPVMYPDGIEPL